MSTAEQAPRSPEGWEDSTDDQKKVWLEEAERTLEQTGRVPENTVLSFAVAWDFFERNKDRKWVRRISDYDLRRDKDDYPAEAAG